MELKHTTDTLQFRHPLYTLKLEQLEQAKCFITMLFLSIILNQWGHEYNGEKFSLDNVLSDICFFFLILCSLLQGNLGDLGKLLMQGHFNVWTEHKRDIRFKPMHRHIFLYEKAILMCKRKEDVNGDNKDVFSFKNMLRVSTSHWGFSFVFCFDNI